MFKIVSSVFSWVSFLRRASWIDPSVVRSCHTLDLLQFECLSYCTVAFAPVPIYSKIWEVCFDVNTVLDDLPINSGGATRSRHDDAISGKRLTVPCDSDFPLVSVIRDGLASQQRSSAVFSHSAQHSFLGQIFCCPRCVLTCMQRFRVCLASVQPGFLLYRWSHSWSACPNCFPGCPHVMLHQCFIDTSSSRRRLRDRRRCLL